MNDAELDEYRQKIESVVTCAIDTKRFTFEDSKGEFWFWSLPTDDSATTFMIPIAGFNEKGKVVGFDYEPKFSIDAINWRQRIFHACISKSTLDRIIKLKAETI